MLTIDLKSLLLLLKLFLQNQIILSPIQRTVLVKAQAISYMEMVIKQNAPVGQVVTVQHPQRRKRKGVFLAALL